MKGLEILKGNVKIIEPLKEELYLGSDMIRIGGVLMIRQLLSKTTDREVGERLGEVLVTLVVYEKAKPVILRAGIELSPENKHFRKIWKMYYKANITENRISSDPLCRFLVDQGGTVQKYLKFIKED